MDNILEQWFAALKLVTLVNHLAADQRHQSFGVFDLFGVDGKWILREHDQVGEFSWRQGSFTFSSNVTYATYFVCMASASAGEFFRITEQAPYKTT